MLQSPHRLGARSKHKPREMSLSTVSLFSNNKKCVSARSYRGACAKDFNLKY